jgi:aspartate/methionine/tyrosine aminotransferase
VAITPGRDFGRHAAERFVRFSYASSMAQLREAVERLSSVLERPKLGERVLNMP